MIRIALALVLLTTAASARPAFVIDAVYSDALMFEANYECAYHSHPASKQFPDVNFDSIPRDDHVLMRAYHVKLKTSVYAKMPYSVFTNGPTSEIKCAAKWLEMGAKLAR